MAANFKWLGLIQWLYVALNESLNHLSIVVTNARFVFNDEPGVIEPIEASKDRRASADVEASIQAINEALYGEHNVFVDRIEQQAQRCGYSQRRFGCDQLSQLISSPSNERLHERQRQPTSRRCVQVHR